MRKAQFEIMGLAVIVIIISVMVFFMLSFSFQDDDDLTAQFQEEQFAQNFLDAFSKTNLDGCKGVGGELGTVADYFASRITGMPLKSTIPGENPACTSEEGMEQILGNLTRAINDFQGMSFRFQIRNEPCDPYGRNCGEMLVDLDGGCNPASPGDIPLGKPGRMLISKHPDPVPAEVVLWLCVA